MTQTQDHDTSAVNSDGDFDADDVFGAPPKSINFGDEWVSGETYELPVLAKPELVQGWDDKLNKPAVWPDSGNPKMNAVTRVEFEGEERSLWCGKPSALFRSIQEASRNAGQSVRPGGVLVIKYGGLGKKERGKNAPHLFESVVYIPAE